MTAEQRPCPVCGTEFTWTPAAPRQKYCSKRCKHRWHDRYGKKARRRRGGPTTDVARPPADITTFDGPAGEAGCPPAPAAPPAPGGSLSAAPACPHCRQPVALVAWLVPPAASVTTPPQHIAATRRGDP